MKRPITMEAIIPTAADLREAARQSTSGDPASYSMGRHQGRNPNRKDTDGLTKRVIHDAALDIASPLFDVLAAKLKADPWNLPASLRTLVPKSDCHPEKGTRPIDDPAEYKRLVVLQVRRLLERKLERALTKGQYGGRPKWAILPCCLRTGATHQDHVATAIWQSIWDGYGYCLLLDLKNAFGLVPRKATLRALHDIGLDQRAAEWVWRMVQIDAVYSRSQKTVVSDARFGIEQGNPLSAALMNLVLAPIFKMLDSSLPVKVLSYLDDIYIMARSKKDAHQSFYRFRQSARARGFTNVRRLWGPGDPKDTKLSVMIDTQAEVIPVLKTYQVSPLGIALAASKVDQLRADGLLATRTTISKLRWVSNCQALTKQAVRSMNPNVLRRPPRTTEGVKVTQGSPPTTVEVERDHPYLGHGNRNLTQAVPTEVEPPYVQRRETQETNPPMEDTHRETVVPGDLIRHNQVPSQEVDTTEKGNEELSTMVVPQVMAFPHKPVMGHEDSEGYGISSRGESHSTEGGDTRGRRQSGATDSSACLSVLQPEVLRKVKGGMRFSFGVRFKGAVLDLRGIETLNLSDHVLRLVVNGLVRVVRTRRTAVVKVDGLSPLLGMTAILGGIEDPLHRRSSARVLRVLKDGTAQMVLRLRERRTDRWSPGPIPDVQLAVLRLGHHDRARGTTTITYRTRGQKHQEGVTVLGPAPPAVALMAVARVLRRRKPRSVAIQLKGALSVAQGLTAEMTPRQVLLEEAVGFLTAGWSWTVKDGWVVGERKTRS